jgi:hypothetical protein
MGMTIAEQGPGSLTTILSGSVNAEVTPTTIRFTGASLLDALPNGSWQPLPEGGAGEAPADFGAKTESPLFGTIQAAVRDVILDLQSDALPLQDMAFDASQIQFISPTNSAGAFDYRAGLLAGRKSVSGVSTNKVASGATLTASDGIQTLTLMIDTQFPFTAFFPNDSMVSFTGKIVATRPLESPAPAPLELQSITLGNNQFILRVKGVPATTDRVESSPDLQRWQACQYEMSVKDGYFTVTRNPSARSEFYRITR